MMNKRNWLYLAAAGVGTALGLGYQWWGQRTLPQARDDSAGTGASTTAPKPVIPLGGQGEGFFDLSFDTPEGKPLAMASFEGKPLLVNFWGTWCPPCIEELPLIDAFFKQNSSKNWQTIGLAADQPQAVQNFLRKTPLSFPVAMTGFAGIDLSRKLGNTTGALPFSVLFDAKGKLVQRKLGKLTQADLKAWAEQSA